MTMVRSDARAITPWWLLVAGATFFVGYLSGSYDLSEPRIQSSVRSHTTTLPISGENHTVTVPNKLPNRVITVFGLESSGTTFLTNTLKAAIGGHPFAGTDELHIIDKRTELQHLSLPWGYWHMGSLHGNDLSTIPVLPPKPCMIRPDLPLTEVQRRREHLEVPDSCRFVGITEFPNIPQRFFVNVTSHVRWYRSFGIQATAVVVVRDEQMHLIGKLKHAELLSRARKEDIIGKEIVAGAITELSPLSELILVSYETLMSLREAYLFDLYRKLGIDSRFVPEFVDGNGKYIQPQWGTKKNRTGTRGNGDV